MFAEYKIDDLNEAGKLKLKQLRALITALEFFKQYVENYKTKHGQYKIINEPHRSGFCTAYKEKTGAFAEFCYSPFYSEKGHAIISTGHISAECCIKLFDEKTYRYIEDAPANIQAEIDKLKHDMEVLAPLYTNLGCLTRKLRIMAKMKVAKKALKELNEELDYPRSLVKSSAAKNCGGLPYMSISTKENH